MDIGKLTLESVMIIALVSAAGIYVLRHVKNVLLDGDMEKKCSHCVLKDQPNPEKEKSPLN